MPRAQVGLREREKKIILSWNWRLLSSLSALSLSVQVYEEELLVFCRPNLLRYDSAKQIERVKLQPRRLVQHAT